MDEENVYTKFNEFLTGFLLRRVEGTLTDDDFDEKHSDIIRPHLENVLPTLSLPEAMRIQTYFNEALCFHLQDALGRKIQTSCQKSFASGTSSEVQLSERGQPVEAETQKEISQIETPHEAFTFAHRRTTGMMQSTPLSVPAALENETIHEEQPEYAHALEDPFINDIMAQINLSPIPQELENQPMPTNRNANIFMQRDQSLRRNIEDLDHPFLRNFANRLETGKRKKNNNVKDISSYRQLKTVEIELSTPKPKRKKIPFESLCSWEPKEVNENVEEFFLHFPLLPQKMGNLIKRATGSIRTGKEQSDIPTSKIMNLSNVLRAYAGERQSSVELPRQGSFLPSPCTPLNLLRTSQHHTFTPIRGDASSQLLGLDTEQIHFQTRSAIRQEPLLTIPERDSLMPKLTDSLDENLPLRDSLTSITRPPVIELTDGINLGYISENIDEIPLEVQPEDHIGSLNILPQYVEQNEPSVQNQNIVQDDVPRMVDDQVDDAEPNWFEILRPRLDVVYPTVSEKKRKRKNRKRHVERDTPPRRNREIQDTPAPDLLALPTIPLDISEQVTEYPVQSDPTRLEHDLRVYIELLKEAVKDTERTWEHFDPFLFTENDDFEMYTHIFKRIIREDFVSMHSLYEEGTSRLNAARGFRLLLELQTMGLIEVLATGIHIDGFKYKSSV